MFVPPLDNPVEQYRDALVAHQSYPDARLRVVPDIHLDSISGLGNISARMRSALIAVLIAFVLCGCSASANVDIAKKATDAFHQQMSAESYDAIYESTNNAFRSSGSREQINGFLKRVNRKMGACGDSTLNGWNFNFNTAGNFVSLNYTRKCASGDLREQFVWQIANGKASLQQYVANHPSLLTD
jgi:hypothetical protein